MDHERQPLWDAAQYARFRSERARPFDDLVTRIDRESVRTIADIGCGDGSLTRSLLDRWPGAEIWGIDSSKEMLARAPQATGLHFVHADLTAEEFNRMQDERGESMFTLMLQQMWRCRPNEPPRLRCRREGM